MRTKLRRNHQRKESPRRMRASWTMLFLGTACVRQFCLAAGFPNAGPRSGSRCLMKSGVAPSPSTLFTKQGPRLHRTIRSVFPSRSTLHSTIGVRGGALKASASSHESTDRPIRQSKRNIALWAVGVPAIAYLIVDNRVVISTFLDKDHLQAKVLHLLHAVEAQGAYGVVLYALGMAFWELLGMSTIPVETAAGMAFGFRRAFAASAVGKLLGAVGAYVLGKGVLHDFVRAKLQGNKVLKLVDGSVQTHPFRTALLMRYSVFPEFVKNTGASLFPSLRPWMFVLSVAMHGWGFTAVWTYLGVDTARRLEQPHLPVDRLLKISVTAATLVGIVITPLLMAWWIRDMQESQLNTIEPEDK